MKWKRDNTFIREAAVIHGRVVPFAGHGRASSGTRDTERRAAALQRFIGRDLESLETLDIGPPNSLSKRLGIKHQTLYGDLNDGVKAPGRTYDLILNSEVLEHVMNPLGLMRDCYELLRSGGMCIVATPLYRWHSGISHNSRHHFVEYQPKRLHLFFEYVGFEVVDNAVLPLWDRRFAFYGIRPILRLMFHRSQVWKLRRPR